MNPNQLNRRAFLSGLVASGAALSISNCGVGAVPLSATLPKPGAPFEGEAARLTQACLSHFWDQNSRMFRAPVLSAETVASDKLHDRGYTFWPSLLGLHALIEGEKIHSGRYTAQISMVYDGLEQYYSKDLHAYTSWLHFPGNTDAYYDDNSWAVTTLVEAALACRKAAPQRATIYLNRARTVMADFVVKSYDATGKPGGVRWGTDPTKPNTSDRGTSSTAGSALAALMLARAGVEAKFYTQWAYELLDWLTSRLQDGDGLVMDALAPPDWAPRRIKWTYNTGVPLRAYIEHYRLTKNPHSLAMATRLAKAALNAQGALFDQKVQDVTKRSFWDGTYFVQYLVDGLLQFAQVSPDAKLVADARGVATRTARTIYTSLRDPGDGFYWRNLRLYTIGETQHDLWQKWTGQTIEPEYDATERSQEAKFQALPVKDRPLVKTLLANVGVARLFWLVSR